MYPVKPSFLIKSIWFSGGAAAAYAAYYATFKDLWGGAKMVRQFPARHLHKATYLFCCTHLLAASDTLQHVCLTARGLVVTNLPLPGCSSRVLIWTGTDQSTLVTLLQVARAHGTLPPVMQEDAERKQQERLFGPAARAALGAQWNSLVDNTLGRLAQELAKRGI